MMFSIVMGTMLSLSSLGVYNTTIQPEQSEQQATPETSESMPASIARVRLRQAMDHATPFETRQEMLAEIVARCDDSAYQSAAAYNLGVAFMKHAPENATSLSDAIDWLRRADSEGTDPALRARARDSIGHARYLIASTHTQQSPAIASPQNLDAKLEEMQGKLRTLIESAGAFRSAHDVDRTYRPAIENLERVRREIRTLRDQISALKDLIEQQRQAQQERQQQQQESADRLDELAEQQQQEANENQSDSSQQPEGQREQQEDQEELSDQTQREQEGLNKDSEGQSEQMQDIQDELQRARDAQERAKDALDRGDTQQAAREQQEAAEALRNAAEQLRDMAGSDGQGSDERDQEPQPGDQQEGQQQGEAENEEGDQISEIAQQLLEKERREREARKVYRRTGRPVPVERDW